MKKLDFEYQMDLSFSEKITEQRFQLKCLPQENSYQRVLDLKYSVSPVDSYFLQKDGYGNQIIVGNSMAKHQNFHFDIHGQVEIDFKQGYTESCHPMYNFMTALTKYSDDMAFLIPEEADFEKFFIQLTSNIYYSIKYQPNVTNNGTTAAQAIQLKKGVCQDFSHVFIAICHHLKYPARYVAGMLIGEGATHAWVEVYHDGKWYGYDPTNNRQINDNYIVLSKGRDYHDCIIDKGIFNAVHFSHQKMDVFVSVKEAKE